jgi:hypothetical protein
MSTVVVAEVAFTLEHTRDEVIRWLEKQGPCLIDIPCTKKQSMVTRGKVIYFTTTTTTTTKDFLADTPNGIVLKKQDAHEEEEEEEEEEEKEEEEFR